MNARRLALAALATLCAIAIALAFSGAAAQAALTHLYSGVSFGPKGIGAGKPLGRFDYLQGIAVDQSSGDVYVYDAEASEGSIYKFNSAGEPAAFSASGADVIKHVGEVGEDEGELAVDSSSGPDSGDIFFATGESGAENVLIYSAAGTKVGELKETSGVPWGDPCGVAVDSKGNVYVGLYPEYVDKYTPKSGVVSDSDYVSSLYGVEGLCNLAADSQGDVYADEYSEGPVFKYAASQFNTEEEEASGSEVDEAGSTLFVDPVSDELFIDEIEGFSQYGPSGSLLARSGASGPGALEESFGIAVDHASGDIYVDSGEEEEGVVEIFGAAVVVVADVITEGSSGVTPEGATLSGSVDPDETTVTACKFEYGPTKSYGHSEPCSKPTPFSGDSAVAVTAELSGLTRGSTYHYRLVATNSNGSSYGSDQTLTTPSSLAPTVSIAPVTAIAENSATFNGEVNPHEGNTTYRFEYSTDGSHWTVVAEASVAGGAGETPVSQPVSNLTGNTTYHVRLVAVNTGGSSPSGEVVFSTLAAPPGVLDLVAGGINAGEATLFATIRPENRPTSYRFEYGTTTAYGASAPTGEGATGTAPVQVFQTIAGLSPGTTYHYRVVADNGAGEPTVTPDQTFTTLVSTTLASEHACPNEQLRAESDVNPTIGQPYSAGLPECRAYEMVSPPEKGANDVEIEGPTPVAADGNAVEFLSPDAFGDAENAVVGAFGLPQDHYVARRGSGGWMTSSATPPRSLIAKPSIPKDASPEDFNTVTSCGNPTTVNNATSGSGAACALRETSGPWISTPAYPAVTGGVYGNSTGNSGLDYEGSSSDLSHLVFSADEPGGAFLPSALLAEAHLGGASLYDVTGLGEGTPELGLVNVDDSGEEIGPEHSTRLGGIRLDSSEPCAGGPSSESGYRYQAISADGSIIYFTACPSGAGGVDTVYARINQTSTVAISDPSPSQCTTCAAATSPAEFVGASTDGSKSFFVTSQELLNSDTDTTADLYEYDFHKPEFGKPEAEGENLVQLSYGSGEPGTTRGRGAEVQGVVGTSSDGSHVYFVARGLLTKLPNGIGQVAVAGADNLYGVDTETGETKFVAELCSNASESGTVQPDSQCPATLNGTIFDGTNDIALWNVGGNGKRAQETSDGRYLLFDTYAALITSGSEADTNGAQQVYRYDFQTGELIRASIGEPSFPESRNGNTPDIAATIDDAPVEYGAFADFADRGRAISEDGSTIVFSTAERLQADDTNTGADPSCSLGGTGCDVYEWHECPSGACEDGMAGEVRLISPGDDPTSSDTEDGNTAISASGSDIFFYTRTPLVGQDPDQLVDIYDARVDGGFPAPAPQTSSCSGEACQGKSLAAPAAGALGTLSSTGAGNFTPLAPIEAPKPRSLTRAQKLASALRACAKRPKKQRAGCERQAQKRYGPKPKPLTRAQKLAKALKACARRPEKQRAGCERRARKRYRIASKAKRTVKQTDRRAHR